jgi:hypothetical protein
LAYILVNRQTGKRAYRGYWKCEDHSGHHHVSTAAYETQEIIAALFLRDDSGQAFPSGKLQPQAISGMDQGSDFEGEFRARRIRLRGNFAHKPFYNHEIIDNCGPYVPRPINPTHLTSN